MDKNKNLDLDYIKNLNLKIPDSSLFPTEQPVSFLEGKPQGMIIYNTAVAFTANVTDQNREDVMNSVLFAQFGADHKVDRYADPVLWYKTFNMALNNLGWITKGFEFSEHKDDNGSFSIDERAVKLVGSLFTGNEILILKASLDALKALSDDNGAYKLFSKTTTKSEKGNVQVGLVDEVNRSVIFGTGAFHFISTTTNSRFLWMKHSSSSMKLFEGSQAMLLNSSVYASAREIVKGRLGPHVANFAQTFPIDVPEHPIS